MVFREALVNDIPQMQLVRNSVKENRLSDPALIPDDDYENYLLHRGKGWVCEKNGRIVGFAILDSIDRNIWALFVQPLFERMGIGKRLHDEMLEWHFQGSDSPLWLGTAPQTRAEAFYRKAGWNDIGVHGKGEIKFEMTAEQWRARKIKKHR